MTVTNDESIQLHGQDEETVSRLYGDVIAGWTDRDADSFAGPFSPDAVVIGFDGSEMTGRASIASEMRRIFADHVTAVYVAKVKSVRLLSRDVALLRAVVGMIPPDGSELMPNRNAYQTAVAARDGDSWRIVLFQNTPARFDGRPELAARLTQELSDTARSQATDGSQTDAR
jgi:uncharacterized protein (TIGR02246 family)